MFEMAELEKPESFEQRAAIMNWNIFGRICGAKHLKNIVLAFGEKKLSQRTLERITKINVSHVNKGLKRLNELGIVCCLTPDIPRLKFYDLTTFGKNIVRWLHEYEQETTNAALTL